MSTDESANLPLKEEDIQKVTDSKPGSTANKPDLSVESMALTGPVARSLYTI